MRCRWRRVCYSVWFERCRGVDLKRRIVEWQVVLYESLLAAMLVQVVARFRFRLAHRRQRMASVAQSRLSAVLAVRLAAMSPFRRSRQHFHGW